jgi:hypothetical protein
MKKGKNTMASTLTQWLIYVMPLLLVGCSGVNPSSMQKPKETSHIALNSNIHWTALRGFKNVEFRYTLAAGTYVSEVEDSEGTYFRGPSGCFVTNIPGDPKAAVNEKTFLEDCGIFVPKSAAQEVKTYFYLWTSRRGNGPTIASSTSGSDASSVGVMVGMNAAPTQLGAGAAVGGVTLAAVDALLDAEKGNIKIVDSVQPPRGVLRQAIVVGTERK